MGRLHDLHAQTGQSPWLDNLRRGWIRDGEIQRWIDRGVRGITSNPSIFQNAIAGSDDYDEQFSSLVRAGTSIEDAYWRMVVDDIRDGLALLAPIHEASAGVDGYISVEVDPRIARDTDQSIADARALHAELDAPNLLVKVPATAEGIPVIERLTADGRSINVTLIFSVARYVEVAEAYLAGLEACEGDLSGIANVASFFISRTDTEVDRRLNEIGTPEALALRGKTAVAQAQVAYAEFGRIFSGPRWDALAARGATVQRPLWASTSVKNPDYSATLYVDTLIGPDTVNTMPEATLAAFEESGTVARLVDADPSGAAAVLDAVAGLGIDLDEVATLLEDQGVASFEKAFGDLLETLQAKADAFT